MTPINQITEVESLKIQNLALKKQMIENEMNALVGQVFRRAGIPDADFHKYVADTNSMTVVYRGEADAIQE